jgi:hypothetical protein
MAAKSAFWSYFCEEGENVASIKDYLFTYDCDNYVRPICGGDDFASTNPGGLIKLGDIKKTCAAVDQASM